MTENPFTIIETRLDRLEAILLRIVDQLNQVDKPVSANHLMTIKEAAEFLNLAIPTIYSKTRDRSIPHFKRGKRLYFNLQDLTDWVKDTRQRTVAEIKADASALMRVSKHRSVSSY